MIDSGWASLRTRSQPDDGGVNGTVVPSAVPPVKYRGDDSQRIQGCAAGYLRRERRRPNQRAAMPAGAAPASQGQIGASSRLGGR